MARTLTVRLIPEPVYRKLRIAAARRMISMEEAAREAIREWLEREKPAR